MQSSCSGDYSTFHLAVKFPSSEVGATTEHVRDLIAYNIPCMVLGAEPILNADPINVDATMGAYLATRHPID